MGCRMRGAPASTTVKHLLVAEPNAVLSASLERDFGERLAFVGCRDFHCARTHLLDSPPDILVTNLRLIDYNGLHLVLLAQAADPRTRCIVHTDRVDLLLIREAQANGAFFEHTSRLPHALAAYLDAPLPDHDRRDPQRFDRRAAFRGGRRAADQQIVV
jgi:hypothetical protein